MAGGRAPTTRGSSRSGDRFLLSSEASSPLCDSPSRGFVGAGRAPLGVAERRDPMDLGGGVPSRRRVPRGFSGGSGTEETDRTSNPNAARPGTPPSGIFRLALSDHDRRREGLCGGPGERAYRGLRSAPVHAAAGQGRDLGSGGPSLVGGDRSERFSVPRPGSQIVDPRTVNFDVHPFLSFPWISARRHCGLAGAGSAPAAANRGTAFARRPADRSGPDRGAELDRRGPAHVWADGVRPRTGGKLGIRRHRAPDLDMAPGTGSVRLPRDRRGVRRGYRGIRHDPTVPSDPPASPPPGARGPLRHDDRFLFPATSTVGGPSDRPLASGGLLLPRDDGKLQGIDAAGALRWHRPGSPRRKGPSRPTPTPGRGTAIRARRLLELVGLRRPARRRHPLGYALDRPSAIRRTRRGPHAPGPSVVPAVEARLHPGDRASRNRDPTTGSTSASVGRRNPA